MRWCLRCCAERCIVAVFSNILEDGAVPPLFFSFFFHFQRSNSRLHHSANYLLWRFLWIVLRGVLGHKPIVYIFLSLYIYINTYINNNKYTHTHTHRRRRRHRHTHTHARNRILAGLGQLPWLTILLCSKKGSVFIAYERRKYQKEKNIPAAAVVLCI